MRYAYYPGCSAESTARDQHMSILAVADALDIELIEPKGWTCCGATPAHQTSRLLASSLPAANLLYAQDMDLDMIVSCAACYNRMKMANHEIQNSNKIRNQIAKTLDRDYDGSVNVRHFLEVILEDYGIEKLNHAFTHSLNGLRVACYYGCLLVRPTEVTQFDDPENPTSMDLLVTAMGGESLDWPHKVECCGGSFSITRTDIVIKLSGSILEMAEASGAQCIAVACPLCQVNLDLRQSDINKQRHKNYKIPIVYITQLLGLCLGKSEKKLGLNKHMVSAGKIIDAINKVI